MCFIWIGLEDSKATSQKGWYHYITEKYLTIIKVVNPNFSKIEHPVDLIPVCKLEHKQNLWGQVSKLEALFFGF